MLGTPIDLLDPPYTTDLHVEMLEALVAGDGLAAVAAIAGAVAGAPVEILIPRAGSDGSAGSDAERHVADLVAGRASPRPSEVRDLVPIVCRGEVEGAVVLLGEGRPGCRDAMETASVVALTAVAILNTRADTSESSAAALVHELLAEGWIPPGEIVRRARLHGCDLSGEFHGVALEPLGVQPGRVVAAVSASRSDALVGTHLGLVYLLLPGDADAIRDLGGAVASVAAYAVSSPYSTAKDAALALREADLLLSLRGDSGQRNTDRKSWNIARFLFASLAASPVELTRFVEEAIGPALRHDEARDAELERTFWAFRDANWNLSRTARLTFAHRHTVRNRLDRIADLTDLNPDDSHDRDLLSLAFTANAVANRYEERCRFLGQASSTGPESV